MLSSSKLCNQAKTMQSQPSSPYATDSLHTHIWGGSRQGYPKRFSCQAAQWQCFPPYSLGNSPGLNPAARGKGAKGGCTAASHGATKHAVSEVSLLAMRCTAFSFPTIFCGHQCRAVEGPHMHFASNPRWDSDSGLSAGKAAVLTCSVSLSEYLQQPK